MNMPMTILYMYLHVARCGYGGEMVHTVYVCITDKHRTHLHTSKSFDVSLSVFSPLHKGKRNNHCTDTINIIITSTNNGWSYVYGIV